MLDEPVGGEGGSDLVDIVKAGRDITAREIGPGAGLGRGDHIWHVEQVREVDPKPISLPYVWLRCRDHNGEVREFTLPSDFPVKVYDA